MNRSLENFAPSGQGEDFSQRDLPVMNVSSIFPSKMMSSEFEIEILYPVGVVIVFAVFLFAIAASIQHLELCSTRQITLWERTQHGIQLRLADKFAGI